MDLTFWGILKYPQTTLRMWATRGNRCGLTRTLSPQRGGKSKPSINITSGFWSSFISSLNVKTGLPGKLGMQPVYNQNCCYAASLDQTRSRNRWQQDNQAPIIKWPGVGMPCSSERQITMMLMRNHSSPNVLGNIQSKEWIGSIGETSRYHWGLADRLHRT